jgi:gluconokinase
MVAPLVLVVMGVSGSGKTTVGSLLAGRLGWPYAEADAFHSEANVAKMAAGHPLTNDDRWPLLPAIAAGSTIGSRATRPASSPARRSSARTAMSCAARRSRSCTWKVARS